VKIDVNRAHAFVSVVCLTGYVVGVEVLQLYANDLDSGENGRATFSLVEPSPLFQVSPSGRITTAPGSSFDREILDIYYLMVKAADGGSPRETGTVLALFIHRGPKKQDTKKRYC